jgi:hypothetical protein
MIGQRALLVVDVQRGTPGFELKEAVTRGIQSGALDGQPAESGGA